MSGANPKADQAILLLRSRLAQDNQRHTRNGQKEPHQISPGERLVQQQDAKQTGDEDAHHSYGRRTNRNADAFKGEVEQNRHQAESMPTAIAYSKPGWVMRNGCFVIFR